MNAAPKLKNCTLCGIEASTDKQIRMGRCVDMVACHRRWENAKATAAMRHNLAKAEAAADQKKCAACDALFTGPGRLCGGNHSRGQVLDAFGAQDEGDI